MENENGNDGMTVEEMFNFCETENKHMKTFDDMPSLFKLHSNKTLCGYLMVSKLMRNPTEFIIQAEHDIIYLVEVDDLIDEISLQDVMFLVCCGIHYCSDFDCLYHHT